MPEYDNSGILSKNDRKTQPNHADYTGSLTISGEEFYLDGWIKERRNGSGKFLSLSVKPKDKQKNKSKDKPNGEKKEASGGDDYDF